MGRAAFGIFCSHRQAYPGCTYCIDAMSYDQPQGVVSVAVAAFANIPPLVRLSRTNAARLTYVHSPDFHFLEFEQYVVLFSKSRFCTKGEFFSSWCGCREFIGRKGLI
jgi:hypothetical protein